jgi:hypothetical protein
VATWTVAHSPTSAYFQCPAKNTRNEAHLRSLQEKLPRVTYYVRTDTTSETERSVLAAVYAYALSRHREKAAQPAADNDVKENV